MTKRQRGCKGTTKPTRRVILACGAEFAGPPARVNLQKKLHAKKCQSCEDLDVQNVFHASLTYPRYAGERERLDVIDVIKSQLP